MPPKRKAAPTATSRESRLPKRQAKRAKESTASDSTSAETQAFTHLSLLESGHIDVIDRNSNRGEEDAVERPICLILTPDGTHDRKSQRRVVLAKTDNRNGLNSHYVQIDSMANKGTSSEASMINRNTVRVVGRVAVGNYGIIYDHYSNKSHFAYKFTENKHLKKAPNEIERVFVNCDDDLNSFTMQMENQEKYETNLLKNLRKNPWLWTHLERCMFEEDLEMVFTQDTNEVMKRNGQYLNHRLLKQSVAPEYQQLWKKLNMHFKSNNKYQNDQVRGVSEYSIEAVERRLGGITLPDDLKKAIRIHNGRPKQGFGLATRSPTTDLLPLDDWHPYENEEHCSELFKQLVDGYKLCDNLLHEDLKEHLQVYKDEKGVTSEAFRRIKTELLVIGEGMDDYVEQYLLGLRTGTIYLQILNIPEWRKIGTFEDWVEYSLKYGSVDEEEEDEESDAFFED